MSADILRQAASLMRERAEAATSSPWRVVSQTNARIVGNTETVASGSTGIADCWGRPKSWRARDAEHIASWDPVVAKATAELLDAGAAEIERRVARDGEEVLERANPVFHAMTELARTYLHEEG